ncbi:DUF4044 domain-containing protein [Fructobacillus parabroussonetiae]|uniref:DUF4044 domain-containing protein n=1 Tax=Fructobacillus parabroussonetiae TaxID=2713174 RepID=A0ABS5QWN9_9LACO|nr:DUF4044 domain-containing protein [Fructobacillus parabroussonetiae]MBS9337615.1 DUF4044 domain-containing protein [Fructobacillus parabroussonetiae]MCK8617252.1 DUF4044 domain-containing protein [Fructobacillus parabroussonetiae]
MSKKKKQQIEKDQPIAPTVDQALEDEVNRQLNKRPLPTVEKKKKTRYQKWTLFMSLFMVIVMAGSVIYAAISAIR